SKAVGNLNLFYILSYFYNSFYIARESRILGVLSISKQSYEYADVFVFRLLKFRNVSIDGEVIVE
ncbi:MAG: hypothetical protein QXR49_04890, partial [Sulfolobales archaeon]